MADTAYRILKQTIRLLRNLEEARNHKVMNNHGECWPSECPRCKHEEAVERVVKRYEALRKRRRVLRTVVPSK